VFICPNRTLARITAPGAPTYLYHFTRANDRAGVALGLGVFHSAELPYVFGNFSGLFSRAAADEPVIAATQGYWTRFAATGDPNGAGAPAWPAYTAASDAHLEIGDAVRTGVGLQRDVCDTMATWLAPVQ
jgi:para-nitrobenzyl esterase